MPGEIIGTDGIGTDSHGCQAVALEDTEVCALPFERIEALGRQNVRFQHNLHRLLSREIARERAVMMLLGTMHAEQRLAAFLLDLSQRYEVRGYSSSEFVLRMTREEIGSYLGLKLETVSRLFSRFQREGLDASPGTRREIARPGHPLKRLDRLLRLAHLPIGPDPGAVLRRRHRMMTDGRAQNDAGHQPEESQAMTDQIQAEGLAGIKARSGTRRTRVRSAI